MQLELEHLKHGIYFQNCYASSRPCTLRQGTMGIRGANSRLESDDGSQVEAAKLALAIAASLCLKHNFHSSYSSLPASILLDRAVIST